MPPAVPQSQGLPGPLGSLTRDGVGFGLRQRSYFSIATDFKCPHCSFAAIHITKCRFSFWPGHLFFGAVVALPQSSLSLSSHTLFKNN